MAKKNKTTNWIKRHTRDPFVKKSQVDNLQSIFDQHHKLYKQATDRYENIMKKIKMLEEHEYDPDCRYCSENKFVKDAHEAVGQKSIVEKETHRHQKKTESISSMCAKNASSKPPAL